MSEGDDPYKYTDIGGGMNPFGETIKAIEDIDDKMGVIPAKFEALAKSLESIASKIEKGFQPVVKELNKPKIVKATKGLKGMFKSLGGAALQAGPVGLLFAALKPLLKVLEPLAGLFKPFQVILDLISVLITVMVANALQPMFDALQPLFVVIMSLMPVFAELGSILGELFAEMLTPLVDILVIIIPIFAAFLTELFKSEAFIIALKVAMIVLMGPLMWLITNMDKLGLIIETLMKVFGSIYTIIHDVVIGAIRNFIMGIAIMIDAITFGMAGAVDFVNNLMGTLPGGPVAKTSPPIPTKIRALEGLEEGGIALSHGIYELGEGGKPEMVIPLDEWRIGQSQQIALLSSIHDESVAQSYHNRQMIRMKEWKRIFE